jgi:cell division protein FtsQ
VDIQRIQQQVNRQPWIRDVSVRRVWPSQIVVSVIERNAYARWDEKRLISTRGVVFEADTQQFDKLPLINGYVGKSVALLQQYVELKQRLSGHGIELNELREDNKGALSLLLDKQLRVSLGSHDNEQKIRHLLAVFPGHIRPRSERIEHIDFRYNNGFAIAWKDEEEARQQASEQKRSNKNV